jgi:hypothetical protein
MPKVARFAPDAVSRSRWLSFGLAGAALLLLMWSGGLGCPMLRVFHQPCPTCGMSRALALLMHGQWRASLQLQPLALPATLCSWLVLSQAMLALWQRTPAAELLRAPANRGLLLTTGVVFLLVFALWLAR